VLRHACSYCTHTVTPFWLICLPTCTVIGIAPAPVVGGTTASTCKTPATKPGASPTKAICRRLIADQYRNRELRHWRNRTHPAEVCRSHCPGGLGGSGQPFSGHENLNNAPRGRRVRLRVDGAVAVENGGRTGAAGIIGEEPWGGGRELQAEIVGCLPGELHLHERLLVPRELIRHDGVDLVELT